MSHLTTLMQKAISLSGEIVSAQGSCDGQIVDLDLLEEYLECLDLITGQLEHQEEKDEALLKQLEQSHNGLVELAMAELKKSSLALQEHKVRGKSLMKYIDQLPRKLSTFRLKKG